MRKSLATATVAMAIIAIACIDMTPASERGQTVVLVPGPLQPGMQLALTGFQDLQTQITYRARYGNDPDLARRASDGEGGVALTLHPAWADYIADRGSIAARAPLGIDRLVLVGRPGEAPAPIGDPADLARLVGAIGLPSTESESVGMYTRETLIRFGIWSQMQRQLTIFPTVEQTIAALRDGRVAFAFVLGSTAQEERLPIVLAIDDALHQPMLVEALLLDGSSSEARQLYDYLISPQGRGAFLSKGLRPSQ